ncbi:flagellar M-ring protein [Citrobacter koseri]|uniref:Flagellar M-ring protein n=1 Tax=Citrobacter koseri TaxID=545 RepID=A0A447UGZ3_CITKO|nr:flagellar M-ring protein [Citrobacter koseri]
MSATASTATQPKPLEWLNRLRANPRIPLIVAGSAAIAIIVAMVLWAKAPDYRTLFSNLSDQGWRGHCHAADPDEHPLPLHRRKRCD